MIMTKFKSAIVTTFLFYFATSQALIVFGYTPFNNYYSDDFYYNQNNQNYNWSYWNNYDLDYGRDHSWSRGANQTTYNYDNYFNNYNYNNSYDWNHSSWNQNSQNIINNQNTSWLNQNYYSWDQNNNNQVSNQINYWNNDFENNHSWNWDGGNNYWYDGNNNGWQDNDLSTNWDNNLGNYNNFWDYNYFSGWPNNWNSSSTNTQSNIFQENLWHYSNYNLDNSLNNDHISNNSNLSNPSSTNNKFSFSPTLSINKTTFSLADGWELILTGAPANQPVYICAIYNNNPLSCSAAQDLGLPAQTNLEGRWQAQGNWIKNGIPDESVLGFWTEWVYVGGNLINGEVVGGEKSNEINFNITKINSNNDFIITATTTATTSQDIQNNQNGSSLTDLLKLHNFNLTQEGKTYLHPNDPLFQSQKELQIIDFYFDPSKNYTSGAVPIIFIDSGISPHPDLLVDSNISRSFVSSDTNPLIDYSTFEYPDGHGTVVAGIAAAQTNNGIGLSSPAISTRIGSFKVFEKVTYSNGVTSFSTDFNTLSKALEYLLQINEPRFVVNMSLAFKISALNSEDGLKLIETTQKVMNALQDRAVFVSAIGNDGGDTKTYPCFIQTKNNICVGSIDEHGQIPDYGINDDINVLAPHTGWSISYNGNYIDYKAGGTSISVAYVSGVASYLWSQNPSLKPSDIKNAIINGGAPAVMAASKIGRHLPVINIKGSEDYLLNPNNRYTLPVINAIQPTGQPGRQTPETQQAKDLILSPGSHISIYGHNLSNKQQSAWPPTENLGDIEIWINGFNKIPLTYVSENQINLFLPEDDFRIRRTNNNWAIIFKKNGAIQSWISLPTFNSGINPAVFYSDNGLPIILRENGTLVNDKNVPVFGEKIKIFLTGLLKFPGYPTSNEIISGKDISINFLWPNLTNPSISKKVDYVSVDRTEIPGVFALTFYVPEIQPATSVINAFAVIKIENFIFEISLPTKGNF